MRRQLPVKTEIVQHTLLRFPALRHLRTNYSPSLIVPTQRPSSVLVVRGMHIDLFAAQTGEVEHWSIGGEVSALRMHPPFALVAHDPLLAVISRLEIDLLAVEAVQLFFVLLEALRTQVLNFVLILLVELCIFVGRTYLVAADVAVTGLELFGRWLALGRLQQFVSDLFV